MQIKRKGCSRTQKMEISKSTYDKKKCLGYGVSKDKNVFFFSLKKRMLGLFPPKFERPSKVPMPHA
jgi:hypothetical protein